MKNILFVLAIIMLATNSVEAQKMNRQKIKLLKTSFITDALNLTPQEAEKFWPVYNLYTDKIQSLKRSLDVEIQHTIKLSGGIDNMSETEAKNTLDQMLQFEQQIGDNKTKRIKELSKIISSKKIINFKKQNAILIGKYYKNLEEEKDDKANKKGSNLLPLWIHFFS